MLIKWHHSLEIGAMPVITKRAEQEDVSHLGAFPLDTTLEFSVLCPRRLGARAIVLRLARDGEDYRDIPLDFVVTEAGEDIYRCSVTLDRELCGGEDGLFYYEFLFLRGTDTLFSSTHNNVDITLTPHSEGKFRLLVYQKDMTLPTWFPGGTMYHVFVDRFCRGEGRVGTRKDAILNEDWYGGIGQFAPYPGAPVANNEFFGGNLWGVAEKLDYLSSLGVTTIYLSPIFKAYSNHKYDTGDYMAVDEMFGGEAALGALIEKAEKKGMRLILDGVFNHTGDDSRYFNRYGKFDSVGAYQAEDSPYHDWYCFEKFPHAYASWWGIEILPKLNPESESCREFLAGKGGVVESYLKRGIGGWRLDVADELSDRFLDTLHNTVKEATDGEGLVIGEVWENAADKISYGKRRRYFRGGQLDSVMNYPVRNAILAFVKNRDADAFYNGLTELYASYPREVCDSLMNLLGTHDTERILSILGDDRIQSLDNQALSRHRMALPDWERAVGLLKMASILQYTVFGVPSLFYGDEAGMEGGHDPFCRRPYPWGRESASLLAHYRALGALRRNYKVFAHGDFRFLSVSSGFVAYERSNGKERIVVAANRSGEDRSIDIGASAHDALTGEVLAGRVTVRPDTARILVIRPERSAYV